MVPLVVTGGNLVISDIFDYEEWTLLQYAESNGSTLALITKDGRSRLLHNNQCIFEGYVSTDLSRIKSNCVSFTMSLISSDYLKLQVIIPMVAYNNLATILESSISRTDLICVHCSFASEPSPHFIAHKVFMIHKKKDNSQHSFSE